MKPIVPAARASSASMRRDCSAIRLDALALALVPGMVASETQRTLVLRASKVLR